MDSSGGKETGFKPSDKPPDPSKRKFLQVLGATGAALVLSHLPNLGLKAEATEPPKGHGSEFGFNTHLRANPKEGDNLTIETFKRDVDTLASSNNQWIRFNVLNAEVAPNGTPDLINWNTKNLDTYMEALDYTKEAGLKSQLVTSVPEWGARLNSDDYLRLVENFYGTLADFLAGKVDTVQITNEPNVHDYHDYSVLQMPPRKLPDEYVNKLQQVVRIASESLKNADPDIRTTVNLGHWVGWRADIRVPGFQIFDKIDPYIDVVTLDMYPDTDKDEIKRLPSYVKYYADRYKKPVVIGELGMPIRGTYTERDQKETTLAALKSLEGGEVKPEAILLYELHDETINDSLNNSYGYTKADGTPKDAYDDVLNYMKPKK